MEELQELTYILTKYKTRSIEIIGDESRQYDSKIYKLYEAIQKGEVHTDEEAALFIYGEKVISSKYRNLKHELKRRLLNTVFFTDINSKKKREAIYFECWKEWAACQILSQRSAVKNAIRIAENIVQKSIKYEFYDLTVITSQYLKKIYGSRYLDKKKFDHYTKLYEYYKKQEYYYNLSLHYKMQLIIDYRVDSVTTNLKIKEDAEKYYSELVAHKNEVDHARFHHNLYSIRLFGAMGTFDYNSAKSISIEALEFMENHKNPSPTSIRYMLLNKLVCHIQLKEFEEGKATAIKCQDYVTVGAFNWFKSNEFFFMLSFHTGNYQEAYNTYHEITNHPRYKNYSILHETWTLYRMYLHFLYLVDEIQPHSKDKTFTKIRLGRFLNNVPSFSKDKHGMNIPVLIIQMAFLILQRKYDDAAERIDALNKYCDRYLKTDNPNFRCNCFIKMLLQIPISGFHRAGVERRAQRYLDKLKTIEINFSSQAHEVEIIPFDTMWLFITAALQNKFFKLKKIKS